MAERFSSFEELAASGKLQFSAPEQAPITPIEKLSQKPEDIFAREVLIGRPDLEGEIQATLSEMLAADMSLPFIHITPNELVDSDGSVVGNTGNVESILKNGLRKMDTNVGGFVEGDSVNAPDSFVDRPELLVKRYLQLLKHYRHHGSRTNHPNSADWSAGRGAPAAILVDGSLPTIHGTDYEDHFILENGALPTDIIGVVESIPATNSTEAVGVSLSELLSVLRQGAESTSVAS